MDEATSRRVCQLIAGLVVADEDLAPAEDAFVDKMLARFGIPLEEREVIFPIIDKTEASAALSTMTPEVQNEAFGLLIEAACADGQVVDEEQEYLAEVAQVVGVDQAELQRRLDAQLKSG